MKKSLCERLQVLANKFDIVDSDRLLLEETIAKIGHLAEALNSFCITMSDDPNDYPDEQLYRMVEDCRKQGNQVLSQYRS